MRQGNGSGRRVAVLGALAVPAFLLGAALSGPPDGVHPAGDVERAPGHAALDAGPSASPIVSPAGESRPRDAAALPAAAPLRPSDAGAPAGLTVRIVVPAGPLTSDEPVRFGVRWSDGNGRYAGMSEAWGDGTTAGSLEVVGCTGEPGPHSGDLVTAHRFAPGRYRVRVAVTTADCRGRTEQRAAEVTIEVKAPTSEPVVAGESPAPVEPDPSAESPSAGTSTAPTPPPVLPLPLPSVEPLVNP